MRRRFYVCVAVAVSLAIGASTTAPVLAGGYWNVPGTLSQRSGHGYSGGYHAPFILGPIKLDGWGAPNEVRLPCSPSPFGPCSCCTSCSTCGQAFEAPSAMQGSSPAEVLPAAPQPAPQPAPAVAPQPAPTTAPTAAPSADSDDEFAPPSAALTRPLFDAPVQR